ncbi:MAG: hypothetical protein ABFQ53_03205 [Patescibacteria group bacterium]
MTKKENCVRNGDEKFQCDIKLAGTCECLKKIENKTCVFAASRSEINKRCKVVHDKLNC